VEVTLAEWEDCTDGISKLIEGHWRETDSYQDKIVLNPDWSAYKMLMDNDMWFPFILKESHEVVGYASFFVTPMLHFQDHKAADCDMLYIKPEYRTAKNSIQLLLFAEGFLKNYDVSFIQLTAKVKTALGSFLSLMKYNAEEIKYGKYIGE